MSVVAVEGPHWSAGGLLESAGRFPLRVEVAVQRLVGMLLPGVITTTKQARHYAVQVLACAEAEDRGLEPEQASAFVRRCEVVAAGVHHAHSPHWRRLPQAHGEDRLHLFLHEGQLDVAAASRRKTGLSQDGFAGVYQGPLVRMGLLPEPNCAAARTRACVERRGRSCSSRR